MQEEKRERAERTSADLFIGGGLVAVGGKIFCVREDHVCGRYVGPPVELSRGGRETVGLGEHLGTYNSGTAGPGTSPRQQQVCGAAEERLGLCLAWALSR